MLYDRLSAILFRYHKYFMPLGTTDCADSTKNFWELIAGLKKCTDTVIRDMMHEMKARWN